MHRRRAVHDRRVGCCRAPAERRYRDESRREGYSRDDVPAHVEVGVTGRDQIHTTPQRTWRRWAASGGLVAILVASLGRPAVAAEAAGGLVLDSGAALTASSTVQAAIATTDGSTPTDVRLANSATVVDGALADGADPIRGQPRSFGRSTRRPARAATASGRSGPSGGPRTGRGPRSSATRSRSTGRRRRARS